MPATQNITLEPPFHRVLAQHLHNSTVRHEIAPIGIFRKVLAEPDLLTNFINSLELVGLCLVRPNDPEVLHVSPRHFSEKLAEDRDTARQGRAGFLDFNAEATEIRHLQWLAYQATIRDGVGAYPPMTLRS